MNKQEAIRELMSKHREIIFGDDINVYLSRKRTIELVSQIDEPQKPVVPKFVADWVDNSREYSFDFDEWFDYENQPQKVYYWLNPENKRHAELNTLALVTLIVNGANAVEIEQEKLYTVEIAVAVCETSGVMDKDIQLLRELKEEFLQFVELLKLLEEETDE